MPIICRYENVNHVKPLFKDPAFYKGVDFKALAGELYAATLGDTYLGVDVDTNEGAIPSIMKRALSEPVRRIMEREVIVSMYDYFSKSEVYVATKLIKDTPDCYEEPNTVAHGVFNHAVFLLSWHVLSYCEEGDYNTREMPCSFCTDIDIFVDILYDELGMDAAQLFNIEYYMQPED